MAWTVLIAGQCGAADWWRSFSRIFSGAPPGILARFSRTISASIASGS
jgi:hypothetical protein